MVVKVPVIAVKISLCGRIAWGCCHHVCCCCCCFVVAIVCCCCCCFVVCCFLRNSYGSRFLKLPHWTVTALTVLANLIIYCFYPLLLIHPFSLHTSVYFHWISWTRKYHAASSWSSLLSLPHSAPHSRNGMATAPSYLCKSCEPQRSRYWTKNG